MWVYVFIHVYVAVSPLAGAMGRGRGWLQVS